MRVFVASAILDVAYVDELRRVLGDSGDSTWHLLAPIPPHPRWKAHARDAIAIADALLFVTSSRSVQSRHCAWELATASAMGRPCFQWIIETVDVEHDACLLPVVKVGGAEDAPRWNFEPARRLGAAQTSD